MLNLLVIAAVFIAIIVPFVIVPEIAERTGRNRRSAHVRLAVWVTFLLILFVPAIALAPGLLGGASWADWLVFGGAMAVAILYDYYRLNPDRHPLVRQNG